MSYYGSKEWFAEVAKGNVDGHQVVNKFGANGAIPTTLTMVTSSGTYQTPTALTSIEVISDSVNDATGGTGATKIKVWGLSTGWTEVVEEISMNGTTAVALANQYFRIYRIQVSESGTYASSGAGSHTSTITVRTASAGATWGEVLTDGGFGLGTSEIGAFSIPAGVTAYVTSHSVHVDGSKSAKYCSLKEKMLTTLPLLTRE